MVTAAYPTGGFNGFYLQTDGTGGGTDATPGASDAIFVFGSHSGARRPRHGRRRSQVTGAVSEFNGLTEITPATRRRPRPRRPSRPSRALGPLAYPTTAAAREAHEGELIAPTNTFTVTNTFSPTSSVRSGWPPAPSR